MTKGDDPDLLKTALAMARLSGTAAGLDGHLPGGAWMRGRTAEHKAEVARLGQAHRAMQAEIDRYQAGRDAGQDDKANEILLQPEDGFGQIFAISQPPAKQS